MAKYVDTPTDAEAKATQDEVDALAQRIVAFVQDASDNDEVLACAGSAEAAAYLLANIQPNDKLRDDFLAGVRDSFDKYAHALTLSDVDTNGTTH